MATASRARTCERTGCGRPYRARGLCSTHYNQDHQPERHAKVEVPCTRCSKACMKEPTRGNRYANVFCSLECRDRYRKDNPYRDREASTRLVKATRKASRAAAGTRGGVWVAGPCRECARPFVGPGVSARYCSKSCAKRAFNRRKGAARRARHAGVYREAYSPRDVYVRDRWRCHLCHRVVRRNAHYLHPLAPTIDHLVPISRGGADVLSNVRCAHRACNSARGVNGTVQLLLIG